MADASDPQPGVDYPRTFQEFEVWFGSEAACRAYIRRLRWPDGFVCPACGVMDDPSEMSRGLLLCRHCRRQVSLTAGTIFQDTHKPLRLWFLTMWFITSQKNGVSALGLQRVLGIGSYRTAWTWLHKLGRAMVRAGRPCGVGGGDETTIGAAEEGVARRCARPSWRSPWRRTAKASAGCSCGWSARSRPTAWRPLWAVARGPAER